MHKYFSTGQFQDVIKAVHSRCYHHKIAVPSLHFKGTVKLHGTNSSIYNVLSSDELITQSRNQEINVKTDNSGFAKFVYGESLSLFKEMFNYLKLHYPEHIENKTAVIYGEWCGAEIQPKVALSQLDKMFVIFAIKFIDTAAPEEDLKYEIWLKEKDIKEIFNSLNASSLKIHKIFNIYDFKTFELTIDMNNPKLSQNELINHTLDVEAQCPVAKEFGISGTGEGIVWKCVSEIEKLDIRDLIFKVKGKAHSVTHHKTLAPVDIEKVHSTSEFIEKVVTNNRLNQGLEYLKEMNLDIILPNMSHFLKWVGNDCLKEEGEMMKQSNLDRKDIMPAINRKAQQWFFTQVSKQTKNKP